MDSAVIRAEHVAVLRELLTRDEMTKAQLTAVTGWARNTVAQRLAELIDAGWVAEQDGVAGGRRGRPGAAYRFRDARALAFVANFGQDQLHAALVTARGRILVEEILPIDLATGPAAVAGSTAEALRALRRSARVPAAAVAVAIVGVASPVDSTGHAVNPISLPGWFGCDLVETFGGPLGLPVIAENDANLMALGAEGRDPVGGALIFVKTAIGVGAGTVIGGRLHRGSGGLAGELGHTPVARAARIPCTCGNSGCLSRTASVDAIMAEARAAGLEVDAFADLERLAADGDPTVVGLIRRAGRDIGEALVGVVTVLAPDRIVLGGRIALIGELLAAGVRESLYAQALPDLTRDLVVESSPDHHRDAAAGAARRAAAWFLEEDGLASLAR